MNNFFVLGTDTGIGKTFITSLLVAAARSAGQEIVPMKAVQTGCEIVESGLRAPDLEEVLAAAEIAPPSRLHELMAPVRYQKPCSPHLAARLSGEPVEVDRIKTAYEGLCDEFESVVVEAAGGLMVPVTESYLILDLVVDLELPVVLVSRPDLGTINHTLLSLARLEDRGVTVQGVVFVETEPGKWNEIKEDNLRIIDKLSDSPVWGACRHLENYEKLVETPGNLWDKLKGRDEIRVDFEEKLGF